MQLRREAGLLVNGTQQTNVALLFGQLRAVMRGVRTAQAIEVPPEWSEWWGPSGSDHDVDGHRPLGEFRHDLRTLVHTSRLDPQQKFVLDAWSGTTRYPSDINTGPAPLTSRLPRSSAETIGRPLSRQRVDAIRRSGLQRVTEASAARPMGAAITVRPAHDPLRSPWVTDRLGRSASARSHFTDTREVRNAFEYARDLVSVADPADQPPRHGTENRDYRGRLTLLADLDELERRYRAGEAAAGVNARNLAAARAALAVGLWETLVGDVPRATPRNWVRRGAHPEAADPAELVVFAGSNALTRLLKGDVDDGSLGELVRGSADLPPRERWQILQFALRAATLPTVSADVRSLVKLAAVQAATAREDRRAVLLTRSMFRDLEPLAASTASRALQAATCAAVVYSAHHEYHAARAVLDAAEDLVDRAPWAPGRDPTVEKAEWRFQLALSDTAITRRYWESVMMSGNVDAYAWVIGRAAFNATNSLRACRTMLGRLPGFDVGSYRSDSGDADGHYLSRVEYRDAEFHALKLQALLATTGENQATRNTRAALRGAVQDAVGFARADPDQTTPQVFITKVRLSEALLSDDGDYAARLTVQLLGDGWSLYRSVLPILQRLAGRTLPQPLEGVTRFVLERGQAWSDTHERPASPITDEHRRRQITTSRTTAG